jgi:hypothetical protein
VNDSFKKKINVVKSKSRNQEIFSQLQLLTYVQILRTSDELFFKINLQILKIYINIFHDILLFTCLM